MSDHIKRRIFGAPGVEHPDVPENLLPATVALSPADLMTDGGSGPNRRLRVDVAQTSFFSGREFRTFKEWPTATTATYVVKAVVPLNIILHELGIIIEAGSARMETVVGGS